MSITRYLINLKMLERECKVIILFQQSMNNLPNIIINKSKVKFRQATKLLDYPVVYYITQSRSFFLHNFIKYHNKTTLWVQTLKQVSEISSKYKEKTSRLAILQKLVYFYVTYIYVCT